MSEPFCIAALHHSASLCISLALHLPCTRYHHQPYTIPSPALHQPCISPSIALHSPPTFFHPHCTAIHFSFTVLHLRCTALQLPCTALHHFCTSSHHPAPSTPHLSALIQLPTPLLIALHPPCTACPTRILYHPKPPRHRLLYLLSPLLHRPTTPLHRPAPPLPSLICCPSEAQFGAIFQVSPACILKISLKLLCEGCTGPIDGLRYS